MVTKVYAPFVWGARGNGQAHVCTHLIIYKVIL